MGLKKVSVGAITSSLEDDLKNEDYLKKKDDLKKKDELKKKTTSK